jgi:glyoxylase-like metal-dependent hydrolase (beta-lactamase superfamily II)
MQEIEHGIFYETGYPGVTLGALALPHGTVFVDAPLRAEDARTWRNSLLSQGGSANRLLVNLDAHPDRSLGARALDCTIVAHQKTAQVFRSRPSVFKGQNVESGAEWETQNESMGTRWALPDITYSHSLELHWGPPDVLLEHHPGPALGATWVVLPAAKVIFVGDTVLPNQPPFLSNGDLPLWIETLDVLLGQYRKFHIISGRGGLVNFETVQAQQRLLKNILKGLEKLAKRNAPLEATADLLPNLMSSLSFSPKMDEQYSQRLRHGLYQYYGRRYRPTETLEQY